MSDSSGADNKYRVTFLSIALAVVMAMLWAVIIASFWYFFKIRENDLQGTIFNWIARFHILLIHVPIGLIFLVIVMEIFGKLKGFSSIRDSTPFVLWITFVGAILASILGFLLMTIEDYSGKAMTFHLWTGLGVVVICLFALIFRLQHSVIAYNTTLAAAALCTAAAGHYGGALVHEADYLSEYAPEKLRPLMLFGLSDPKKQAGDKEAPLVETPLEERLVYSDLVVPMLEKTCNQCHNENKIKGKLRMDTHELLLAGAEGSDIPTVLPGKAEESNLILRVTLDPSDDEFMPTEGDPLTPAEVELLKLWIQAGAKTDTTVAQLGDAPEIRSLVASVAELLADSEKAAQIASAAATSTTPQSEWDSLPAIEQQARLDAFQEAAGKINVTVTPVSAEDSRLQVSVLNGAAEFGDEQIMIFEPVAERIAQLDLAKSQITDAALKVVGQMTGLERLHLQNTAVTDAGIAELKSLTQLSYLNLYGTQVSNEVFAILPSLPSLKKLYVWETKIDPDEARRYEQSVNLVIDTGIDLEQAAKEKQLAEEKAQAEEEARKKAEEEAAARKKAEEEAAARKKAEEEAAARKKAEEEAARKKAEEEAAKEAPQEAPPAPAPVNPQ